MTPLARLARLLTLSPPRCARCKANGRDYVLNGEPLCSLCWAVATTRRADA